MFNKIIYIESLLLFIIERKRLTLIVLQNQNSCFRTQVLYLTNDVSLSIK